jgi:outer membrane immunogenic protein
MRAPIVAAVAMLFPIGAHAGELPSLWSGYYAGANAGYTWGDNETKTATTFASGFSSGSTPFAGVISDLGSFNAEKSGFIGGLQIGRNWQFGQAVAGIEADIQGSSAEANRSGSEIIPGFSQFVDSTASTKLDYLGTLRGRLGFLATPWLLIYGTGGLAYGGGSADVNQALVPNSIDTATWKNGGNSGTQVGWTAGAGVEFALFGSATLKAEYLYYDLGSFDAGSLVTKVGGSPFTEHSVTSELNGNVLRVGLNFHLN